jgi:hypothetical protein
MRRFVLILLTALFAFAATPAAAVPPERSKLQPAEFTIEAVCDFDVESSDVRVHGNEIVFFDREGNLTKAIIAGNFVVRLTNAETGSSLTLNISGQFFLTPNPDGSQTLVGHGRNLFFTVTPEPFFVFHVGRAALTVSFTEESVDLVFNEVRGKSNDVCDALAEL